MFVCTKASIAGSSAVSLVTSSCTEGCHRVKVGYQTVYTSGVHGVREGYCNRGGNYEIVGRLRQSILVGVSRCLVKHIHLGNLPTEVDH